MKRFGRWGLVWVLFVGLFFVLGACGTDGKGTEDLGEISDAHMSNFFGRVESIGEKEMGVVAFSEGDGIERGDEVKVLLKVGKSAEVFKVFEEEDRIRVSYFPTAEVSEKKEIVLNWGDGQLAKLDSVLCSVVEPLAEGVVKVRVLEGSGGAEKGDVIQLVCDEAEGKELLESEDYGVGSELRVFYFVVLNLDYRVWIASVQEQIERVD